ncbi:MAG: hypothetical protein AAFR42_04760 [Cyanobacteria bacterium J06628_6]
MVCYYQGVTAAFCFAMPDANNPFIGNPFMKGGMDGVETKKTAPPPADPPQARNRRQPSGQRPLSSPSSRPAQPTSPAPSTTGRRDSRKPPASTLQAPSSGRQSPSQSSASTPSVRRRSRPDPTSSPERPDDTATPVSQSPAKRSPSQTSSKTSKRRSASAKSKRTDPISPPTPPPPAPSGPGYKVQVIAKIPVSNNTNLPGRDALWFANYPIIPRVGDCLFQNGMYFRVDAVFLYENNRPGWCADVEVSYYARRR